MADPTVFKCLWIAAMARSGSMWAFNVARAVLRASGKRVLPDQYHQDHEVYACADQAIADRNPKRVWVLKVHDYLRKDTPLSKFINTRRDLRDALVSYMRFMLCDFDQAIQVMIEQAEITDYYRDFQPGFTLHVRYEDILDRPSDVVRNIAQFCDVQLTDIEIDHIVTCFDKTRVERIVREKEADIERRVKAGEIISRSEVALQPYRPGVVRALDTNTGFQSGHVTDYRDGSWREVLTRDQQEKMHTILGEWLNRYGYEVD